MPLSDWNLYQQNPKSKSKPKQIILFLHGVGSNGEDLISLAPYFAQALPDAVFISPDAPFAYDMAPFGRQWFSLSDRRPAVLDSEITKSDPLLQGLITDLCAHYDVPAKHLALVGFSQGTMMSLYTAPRYTETLGAVLGYSGALFGAETLATLPNLKKPPICLIHGQSDDVVPVQAWENATKTLRDLNFNVTGHTTPRLTHSIDEHGIKTGAVFLKERLV
jgi:phospholipase/carboxylesterase